MASKFRVSKKAFAYCAEVLPISPPLGIGDLKMGGRNIIHRFLHDLPAFYTQRLIKSGVDLIAHAMIPGGIDDLPVEFKNRIGMRGKMFWDFGTIGIEADTEIILFRKYLIGEFFTGHGSK